MEKNINKVPLNIKVGDKFINLAQFELDLEKQCKSKFVQLYKKEARTIQSARNKKIVRFMDLALEFYSIQWCCIHGGRKFQTRGKGIRKTSTLRKDNLCPVYIQIRIAESGKEFIVVGVNFEHNHIVAKELYKQLPHNRRLPDDVKADAKKLLAMKANKHMLWEDLEKKSGQTVTLKDLRNLQHASKSHQNDIQTVSELIKTKFTGADCHVLIEEDNNIFQGLFFSSQEMINSMITYPEMVFLDATFKLLAIKAPVYIILNVDGNGESDIAAVGVLMNENKESLEWFLQTFKDSLPSETAAKITNVMTDKDLTERNVLRTIFPGINLHICLFHALKIFRSEITCEKFQITSNNKVLILELLQKLVYSTSEKQFSNLVAEIKQKSIRIYEYLKENWINIKDEWCPYLGHKSNNFMNTTNNRLEGINSKLKAVIDKHSSLEEFIHKLAIARDSLEKEKNARIANHLNKRRTYSCVEDFENEYFKLITPYAFRKLQSRFLFENLSLSLAENTQFYNVNYKSLQLQTTANSCTCYFNNSMGLPCKHIFAVRHLINQPLFDQSLILDRWKMTYFMENCRFLHLDHVEQTAMDNPLHIDALVAESRKKPMTSQEKYRKTFVKAKLMASLACDLCGDKYHDVNTIIDAINHNLQNGRYDFVEGAILLSAKAGNSDSSMTSANSNQEEAINVVEEEDNSVTEMTEEAIDLIEIENNLVTEKTKEAINVIEMTEEAINSMKIENNSVTEMTKQAINVIEKENNSVTEKTEEAINVMEVKNKAEKCDSNNNYCNDLNNSGTSHEFDLHSIKVPVCKRRGRPAGSDITVIGIPKRKKKLNKLLPFPKKPIKERLNLLLKWIMKDVELVKIRQISIHDLLLLEEMDIRILEVNITILNRFFVQDAWKEFKNSFLNRVREIAKWTCNYCGCDINDKDPTICCDFCLFWYHIRCAGTTTISGELFICASCK